MNIELIALIISTPVLTLVSGLVGMYLQRKKTKAEVSVIQEGSNSKAIENEFKAYSGYQSVSKDYAELADMMSEKFISVKKELTLLKVQYNDQITALNAIIKAKSESIASLEKVLQDKTDILDKYEAQCAAKIQDLNATIDMYIDKLNLLTNTDDE